MNTSNRRYIILLGLIVLAVAAYTGFWFYARDIARQSFEAWAASERARGHQVSYTSAEWSGYPVRLGLTLTGLVYKSAGLDVDADILRAEVLPWNPRNGLIRGDGHVRILLKHQGEPARIALQPVTFIASVKLNRLNLLDEAGIELRDLQSEGVWWDGNAFAFNVSRMQLDTRFTGTETDSAGPDARHEHDGWQIGFSSDGLVISEGFAPALGPKVSSIRLATWVHGLPAFSKGVEDRDLSRLNVEVARLDFEWGGVSTKGTGAVKIDSGLRPDGQIDFRILGIGKLIEALTGNGILKPPAGMLPAIPDVAGGTPMTLLLKEGQLSFGPYAIGQIGSLK
jgi:hypothetical protein